MNLSPLSPLSIARAVVGRRHRITRMEMAEILTRCHAADIDLSNGHVAGTVCVDPTAAGRAWANLCTEIVTVSVFSPLQHERGCVRYDEPGSMHPLQHAPLMFVPADIDAGRSDGGSTIDYLRGHADRVLLVCGEPLQATLADHVHAWQHLRNSAEEGDLLLADAEGARACGCATLAALLRVEWDLRRATGPVSAREVLAQLAGVVALARGEAQDRLRRESGDAAIEVPGVVAFGGTP